MITNKKKKEVISQIHELLAQVEPAIISMVETASTSGALTDSQQEEGNYLLSKALITIYFRKEPYGPLDIRTKKEVANLAHFV